MKKLCFLLLFGAAACTQQPTDHFILRGTVPGVMDSTKVTLRTVTRWDKDLASAYVIDGKFELRGQLDAPTLCKLSLTTHVLTSLIFLSKTANLPLPHHISTVCHKRTDFTTSEKKRTIGWKVPPRKMRTTATNNKPFRCVTAYRNSASRQIKSRTITVDWKP